MLIEHRTYTLGLGGEALFWQAQRERGEDGLKLILERLIGAFSTGSGPTDQIISLYRYDNFEDWHSRLSSVYAKAQLQPYFRAVRPLITRQESQFLVPAPLTELTPYWGNGRDQQLSEGALFGPDSVIEQTTFSFRAGGVPACWEALRQHVLSDDPRLLNGIFATFSSIVGALNEVLIYRHFPDTLALLKHRQHLSSAPGWVSFQRSLAPLSIGCDTRLLTPSPIADMSPLFA